jgi:hypothetical protein
MLWTFQIIENLVKKGQLETKIYNNDEESRLT